MKDLSLQLSDNNKDWSLQITENKNRIIAQVKDSSLQISDYTLTTGHYKLVTTKNWICAQVNNSSIQNSDNNKERPLQISDNKNWTCGNSDSVHWIKGYTSKI